MAYQQRRSARRGRRQAHAQTARERAYRFLTRLLARQTLHLRTFLFAGFLMMAIVALAAVIVLQGTPTNSSSSSGWVPTASSAPQDVLAAARQTETYQVVASSAQTPLGQALSRGSLGAPVLVRAYRPAAGTSDVYVVPVYGAASATAPVALLDFAYDSENQQMRALSFAGPFVPQDVLYKQPFPRLSADQALAALRRQRGVGLASGDTPALMYFAADMARIAGPNADLRWTGGGQFPDYAIWNIQGADGHQYFVGIDGNVYQPDQLPLASQG